MKMMYGKYLNMAVLAGLCAGLVLSGCVNRSVRLPVEKTSVPKKTSSEKHSQIPEPVRPEQPLVKILSREAEKFFIQKNYQDGLLIYNQAFASASEKDRPALLEEIESALARTPAPEIEKFMAIKNIQLPGSLLLYWTGLNYAASNDRKKAAQALEKFLTLYPSHPYFSDAKDLLHVIRQSFFRRDTIGCLLPLTGKYASFGQRALLGIQVAIQELSEKYHKKFNLIIKDTHADSVVAEQEVEQLKNDNVAGIVGPLLALDSAGAEAQKLQIPMIAMTQKSDFPLRGDYLFSNFITPQMQVETLGAYLFSTLGLKKAAILYPDEKYGRKYMNLFWDVADRYGAKIMGAEAYDGRKTDFTIPIQKLTGQFYPVPECLMPEDTDQSGLSEDLSQDMAVRETKPNPRTKKQPSKIEIDFQALFIPDSASALNMLLPQLAYNDIRGVYLVGTNLWHNKSLLKNSDGYHNKAVITDGFFAAGKNPATARFAEKFKALFHRAPGFIEAIAHDSASILFITAMDEKIDSCTALKNALQQGNRIFEGATGNTIFDHQGRAQKSLFLITVKKGRFAEITR